MHRREGYREAPRTPPNANRDESPIPAPGELEVLQAFVNTVAPKTQPDDLQSAADLSAWMTRHGLLPSGLQLEASDLERAKQVRAGLRALMAVNAGAELDEQAVAGLDRAAVGARAQVRFEPDGSTRLEPVSQGFDDALGTLLGYVHAARGEGRWTDLKLCGDPECRRAFYDFTKRHNGRWCTKRCGARVRTREFRARNPKRRRRR